VETVTSAPSKKRNKVLPEPAWEDEAAEAGSEFSEEIEDEDEDEGEEEDEDESYRAESA
jgi:hypothetical protein